MNNLSFIETIKVVDGQFCNLTSHLERIENTTRIFFKKSLLTYRKFGDIPTQFRKGVVKCRITYSSDNWSVEYEWYKPKSISQLIMMKDDSIDYSFKYADRKCFKDLYNSYMPFDSEILIVKEGYLTDTSYSNIVFENHEGLYTPTTYLLNGTKRRKLLQEGRIKEATIRVEDIDQYTNVYLINAMIDLNDNVSVKTRYII